MNLSTDPYDLDNPEYQKFLESCSKHCRCKYENPCTGTLAGGICDGLDEEFYSQYDPDWVFDEIWGDEG